MDFNILDWLQKSILGSLMMGVLGSIFASLIMWAIKDRILKLKSALNHAALKAFIHPVVDEYFRLSRVNGFQKIKLFYVLVQMRLTLWLFVSFSLALLFIVLVFMRTSQGGALLSVLAFILIMSIWRAVKCFAMVLVPLYMVGSDVIEDSLNS